MDLQEIRYILSKYVQNIYALTGLYIRKKRERKMSYKVVICGIDTAKLPRLTAAQSEEMLAKIKSGDSESRELFLMSNMRLVLSIVHRFNYNPSLADDIFQVGCLGLVKALNNFDPAHKVMFSTYAVPMIIGEIRRYIRECSALKVSRSLRDTAYQAMQARERLIANNVEDPTLHDIADEMKVPIKEVVCALDAIADPISLYEPAFNDGEDSLLVMDQLSDGKLQEERWVESIDLGNAIGSLPPKERDVLMLRYFEGKTQIEVSNISGISQAQVSRLENNALTKLRREMV